MSETPATKRRALILRTTDCHNSDIDQFVREHSLEIVYAVVTDAAPEVAALIAVHHMMESDADVVVVPHFTDDQVRSAQAWNIVTAFAELVTGTGAFRYPPQSS